MSNFTPAGTGGQTGSKIDEQDGVAVRLILKAISDMVTDELEPSTVGATKISCEVGDDLVIFNDEQLRLISVKNTALSPKEVVEESKRLSERLNSLAATTNTTRELCIVGTIPEKTASLAAKLDDLRSVLCGPVDRAQTIADWQSVNKVVTRRGTKPKGDMPGKPEVATVVDGPESFVVRNFAHRMDDEQTKAEVSRAFRKIVPLADFSDRRVDSLYRDMVATFGEARRARRTVSISKFTSLLQAVTLPPAVQALLSTHRLTQYGYSVDPLVAESMKEDSRLVDRALKRAQRRMRRSISQGLIADLFLGPVKCLECGHGLMANFGGFGRHGLACPRCGFAPYISILYACECEEPCLVVSQPSTVQAELMIGVQQASSGKCASCSRQFDEGRFAQRIFIAPMPWPPEDFTHQDLIDARIDAGLSQPTRNDAGEVIGRTPSALGKAAMHDPPKDLPGPQ